MSTPAGGAGHLEGDVRARIRGPLADQFSHVVDGRIPGSQPRLLGERAPVGAQFGDAYVGSGGPGDQRDEDADGSAADHDDLLALGDLCAADVVHGDRRGLDQRGPVQGKGVGQPDERRGGHGPALLHRAGGVDADEVEVLADVLMAFEAGRAGVVPAQRHHSDRVPGRPAVHAGADADDPAGHLVPQDGGCGHPGVHVAVEDVQVGAADADIGGRELHLAGTRGGGLGEGGVQGAGG